VFDPGSMVISFPDYALFASVDSNKIFCICQFPVVIRFSKIYRVFCSLTVKIRLLEIYRVFCSLTVKTQRLLEIYRVFCSLTVKTQRLLEIYRVFCSLTVKTQRLLEINLTLRRLMSYIYGAPVLDVSRSHTTTQHSR